MVDKLYADGVIDCYGPAFSYVLYHLSDVPMSSTILLVLYMGSIVQCTYDYSSTSVISIASNRLC
jgi:hypothetical protein